MTSFCGRPMLRFIFLLLLQGLHPRTVDAYRIGDAIDTEIWTPKDTANLKTPKRNQMPLFAVDSTTTVGPLVEGRFSLSFEEGFRTLPRISLSSPMGGPLDKLIVTFVFSGGEILSLTSKTIYMKDKLAPPPENGEVTVEYKWIEMEAVDLNGGAFVMFLAIFIVSVYFLFDLCGLCDNGEDTMVGDQYTVPSGNNYSADGRDIDPLAVMSGSSRIPKYE